MSSHFFAHQLLNSPRAIALAVGTLMAALPLQAQTVAPAFAATLAGHAVMAAKSFVPAPEDAPEDLKTSGKFTTGKRVEAMGTVEGLSAGRPTGVSLPFDGQPLQRIGKGVYLDTTDITEFDCVTIGDYSELNALACPQTHLFEDRVMKIDHVTIGQRVYMGPRSAVLYSAVVADNAKLGALTLVMKGEFIPAASSWKGCPAVPARS